MKRIFWGFCINRFLINPLQYLSSRSNFGFEFAEILEIKNESWGVDKIACIQFCLIAMSL